MRLKGSVAIVTGSARGLGREFALCLAEEGAKVVAASSSSTDEIVGTIKEMGREAVGVKVDITDSRQTEAMARTAIENFKRIDILVNNAALYGGLKFRLSENMDEEEWDRVLQVNVKGTWLCCKAVIPYMKAQKSGAIINIGSSSIFQGLPMFGHYVSSKGAVWAFTRSLSRELGDYNVRVNSITPGYTMTEASMKISDDPEELEAINQLNISQRIIKRAGQPNDLRGALLFLASDDSSFISGQNINVDGGAQHY